MADDLATQTIVPRTTIPLTAPPPETAEGGNIRTLATVGSIRIDGLCRITRGNGTGDDVANDFSNGVENESEAKIIVVSTNGPVSFEGSNGPRFNVPEGEPTYLQFESQDTTADSQTGEGKHMLVAASNEDTDRRPNEEVPFQGFFPGFATSQGALVTNTGGTELLVNMYAGIAINGVADQCSFGGVIQRLDR